MRQKTNAPANLLGFPISTYKEYKLNGLSLAFKGKIQGLEKEFYGFYMKWPFYV
ncbi:hypothetical protein ES708_23956 [subsurface metagenome]